jgi:hypothetical protein
MLIMAHEKYSYIGTFAWFLLSLLFVTNNSLASSTQGFTVTSVSLANVLHPGQPASQTQWLLTLSLNGGGQSLAGTLDSSSFNFQGITASYPLQISGSTDPETAFYVISNSNPTPVYSFSSQTQTGNITNYIVYVSATPAPNCATPFYKEWDVNFPSGWLGLQSQVTIARICIYQQQVASETAIPPTPNIQFSSHFSLLANGQQETLDLSYDKTSASSPDGLVQASWVGSLITGNAPPDGSQYVAINNPQTGYWIVKSASDYQNWNTQFQYAENQISTVALYTPNTLPSPCSSIAQATNNQYVSNITTCLNNLVQNLFSQSNQYATNLLANSATIGGSTPELTSYGGKSAFSIPLNNYFVTNPVVTLSLNGSFLGVVIPMGTPKILTATSETFNSGSTGTIKVNVENIGNSQGTFYASLSNCPGLSTTSPQNYAVNVGQTQEIDIPISTTGTNEQLSESCMVNVTDYNGGGSDSATVNVNMVPANQCAPNTQVVSGNSVCPCVSVNGVWRQAAGSQCKACKYGVVSDNEGGWKCASSPAPETQKCPSGQVLSKDTYQCIDPSQLVGYPRDTSCTSGWPSHQGSTVQINENNNACDLFEVNNPSILNLAGETAQCFSQKCLNSKCNIFCAVAYAQSGALYSQDSDTFKKFAALYLTYALGPAAEYMKDYFYPEICCSSTSTSDLCDNPSWLGKCEPSDGFNDNVRQLPCQGVVGHPLGWASDTDMSKDSCIFSDLPAHADLNILDTGTCVDYSVSLTTLLRYVGYKSDEVYSVTGPGHEYNLVKLPGSTKWNLIDTVGNNPSPYNSNDVPGTWFPYCQFSSNSCANDNGQGSCPPTSEVYGC